MNPLTRPPPEITSEEAERMVQRGARIVVTDPRITQATNWILGSCGAVMIMFLAWIASSVDSLKNQNAELRQQNATLIAQIAYMQRVNDNQDSRLTIYDDRLRAVEREFYPRSSNARSR